MDAVMAPYTNTSAYDDSECGNSTVVWFVMRNEKMAFARRAVAMSFSNSE